MKNIYSVVVMLILGGCTSPAYIPPSSGPLATLVYPVVQRGYSPLGGSSAFGARFAIKGEDGCGKIVTSKLDEIGGNLSTVSIPANQTIFVIAEIAYGNTGCNVVGCFEAIEGEVYKVVRGAGANYCSIGVLTSEGKTVVLKKGKIDLLTGKKACEL